jgi:Zn-dependent metalloprotease
MKTTLLTAIAIAAVSATSHNATAQTNIDAKIISVAKATQLPNFIKYNEGKEPNAEGFASSIAKQLALPNSSKLVAYNTVIDELGFTHTRYKQYVGAYPIEHSMVISHAKNGKIKTLNGDYYTQVNAQYKATITESVALALALKKINAKHYMWQSNNGKNDYTPKAELVIIHKQKTAYNATTMRLAYKFNIYADKPLYRANIYIDALNGTVVAEENLIHTADVTGPATTKYSGPQTITCNSINANLFELKEAGRGNGIETRNYMTGTTVDTNFTNPTYNWNSAGIDGVANEAHFGTEKTYDYYKQIHNRNSIDGNGFALKSRVHYDLNFVNAFWDGQQMTYGDGDTSQGYSELTSIDVCGHEITHGLTQFTAGLIYAEESGALNEAMSDIFGNTIEAYARPGQNSWKIGEDFSVNGLGFRDMSNPNAYMNPSTYKGLNWDFQSQEVHDNSGVANYWYYLLSQGGAGTNDIGNSYNITGLTMDKAAKITFRGLVNYFTPSTSYNDAYLLTAQASEDLYGACSVENKTTMYAWYAVGVGNNGAAQAIFTAVTNPFVCSMPAPILFKNKSGFATSYTWDFGDGSNATSTASNTTHNYTASGTYIVKLIASGTNCSIASVDTLQDTITVGALIIAGTLPVNEGFETSTNLPNSWTINNPNPLSQAWEVTPNVSKTGSNCLGFNNCFNTPGFNYSAFEIKDNLYTTKYDFTNIINPLFTFDVAYKYIDTIFDFGNGTIFPYTVSDTLALYSSVDCGNTWSLLYKKSHADLATSPYKNYGDTTCWTPAANEWRNDTVNIASLAGQPNIIFSFENLSNGVNWIYIDNLNIKSASNLGVNEGVLNNVKITPNPNNGAFTITSTQANTYKIINELGQTVKTIHTTTSNESISVNNLNSGMYMLYDMNTNAVQKIIINK